jgi:hypothetical protein
MDYQGPLNLHIDCDPCFGTEWFVYDRDSYDGAPDSRNIIGWGKSPTEAVADFWSAMSDALEEGSL